MSVPKPAHAVSPLNRLVRVALAALPLLALAAAPASALTDEEMFRAIRFHAPVPGARAAAMGGAFIGLADDPSASVTNPAGLGYLSRPELMLEVRGSDPDEVGWTPAGVFDLAGVETYARGLALIDEEAHAAIPFLSYVHPITDRVVLSVFRHERHDVEREFATGFFSSAFPALEGAGAGIEREALYTQGTLDLLVDTWGLGLGVALHEQFSLGLNVALARLDVAARTDNFQGVLFDGNLNGTPDQLLRSLDYTTVLDDEDTQITFTVGFLWKAHPKISVGAVYREGASFELVEQVLADGIRGPALRQYIADRVAAGSLKGNASGQFINSFDTPDSYGIGVAFGPFFEPRGGGGLTITADAVRVQYTDLLEGFVAGFNNQLFGADSAGVVWQIEDETEFHAGLGYSWTVGYNNQVHVRAGLYNEPDSSILTTGRPTAVIDPTTGMLVRPGRFDGREDDENLHVTLGGGFTLKRGFYSFSLDGVVDFHDYGTDFAGSASFKF